MARHLTGVLIAVALLGVLLGGGCLACWTPVQKSSTCCSETGKCERPGKAPSHSHCAVSPVDLASVEQTAPVAMPLASAAAILPVTQFHSPSSVAPAPSDVRLFDPPDLRLLNSSLVI